MAVKIQNHTAMAKIDKVTAPWGLRPAGLSTGVSSDRLIHQPTSPATRVAVSRAIRCRVDISRMRRALLTVSWSVCRGRFSDEVVRWNTVSVEACVTAPYCLHDAVRVPCDQMPSCASDVSCDCDAWDVLSDAACDTLDEVGSVCRMLISPDSWPDRWSVCQGPVRRFRRGLWRGGPVAESVECPCRNGCRRQYWMPPRRNHHERGPVR